VKGEIYLSETSVPKLGQKDTPLGAVQQVKTAIDGKMLLFSIVFDNYSCVGVSLCYGWQGRSIYRLNLHHVRN
jgi:hypothetical protein